ncbi:LA_3751/LA_3752 family putative glycosyltransferase [Leptospira limi]|uniref:DUF2079 domain-containing protein n=1 Tax=Leptospira limi TaxID=2950023 RepID=A0ABT3LZZ6_9LEPT|nr:hypothetical protein [Leptospira limi]MCW7462918.1 hypothetical protein [Leptospira limi]
MVILPKVRKLQLGLRWFLLFIAVVLSIQYTSPQNSYFQDSHDKLIQTYSLYYNHFQSDRLYYPGYDFDPNLNYFHLVDNLYIKCKDRIVSAFPIQFAAMMAPLLYILPLSYLVYTSLFFLFLGFWILKHYYKFSFPLLWVCYFATYMWPLSWEYSEMSAIFAFSLIGLLPILRNRKSIHIQIVAGLSLSWVIMVRLDTLPFFSFLFFFILFFLWKDQSFSSVLSKISSIKVYILVCVLGTAFQLILNQSLYNHIFGTRFLANLSGFQVSLSQRFEWFQSLNFYADKKVGIFAYLPMTIPLIIFYGTHFKTVSNIKKSLLLSLVLTILVIPFIAPNDGFNNWGPRFYTVLILPYLILLKPLFVKIVASKNRKLQITLLLLFTYSLLLGFIGAKIQKSKTSLVKNFRSITKELNPDIIVFTDYLNLYSIGSDYTKHISIVSYTTEKNEELIRILSEKMKNKKIIFVDWHPLILTQEARYALNADKAKGGYPISHWDLNRLESSLKKNTSNFQIIDKQMYRIWSGTIKGAN